MNFIEALDKAIALTNDAVEIRGRVVKTVNGGVRILSAINDIPDLGETEKAVASRMLTLGQRLSTLLGTA